MQKDARLQLLDNIYLIAVSLLSGNNADVHCMAGCHRGGIIGTALRAILMDQSFDAARTAINQVRYVEIKKALAHYGPEHTLSEWIRGVVKECQAKLRIH